MTIPAIFVTTVATILLTIVIAIWLIIAVILTVLFFWILCAASVLSTADFTRLISTESKSFIFQYRYPYRHFGWYYYRSCVGGNQILTYSWKPLEFPESCELIVTEPMATVRF